MFCVLFEVQPRPESWDAYLGYARLLRPELETIDGFVDNIRYRSLTRGGWILSLSTWRDEKALVRWRVHAEHHAVQEKGRAEVFLDYHLRVGQLTRDTRVPHGHALHEQRLDETKAGVGTTVLLIDAPGALERQPAAAPAAVAASLGFDASANGLAAYDVFEAVLAPGEFILLSTWRDEAAAQDFRQRVQLPPQARLRQVRVIRDYGMFDRREAPQYYRDIVRDG